MVLVFFGAAINVPTDFTFHLVPLLHNHPHPTTQFPHPRANIPASLNRFSCLTTPPQFSTVASFRLTPQIHSPPSQWSTYPPCRLRIIRCFSWDLIWFVLTFSSDVCVGTEPLSSSWTKLPVEWKCGCVFVIHWIQWGNTMTPNCRLLILQLLLLLLLYLPLLADNIHPPPPPRPHY